MSVRRHSPEMARRTMLKNVAGGIAGSFASRNNDVDGFWAMGMLCALASEQNSNEVRIPLRPPPDQCDSELIRKVSERYGAMLDRLLARAGLSTETVVEAVIQVDFSLRPTEADAVPISTWGDPFAVEVRLRDDKGAVRSQIKYSRCGPHDPSRERRSARASDV